MNEIEHSSISASDIQLVEAALNQLRESTGIVGTTARNRHDGLNITLRVAGRKLDYLGTIKQKIDRFLVLEDFKARPAAHDATLLICHAMSEAMVSRCRALDIQFIDTAGNAYIANHDGVLVYVAGRREGSSAMLLPREASITPAAIRMMFGFLANPGLMNAPYATIAKAVKVSTGSIGKVFDTLELRGLLGTTPSGKRLIVSPDLFLSEWAIGYASRLRPKLDKFRFTEGKPGTFARLWTAEFRESAQPWQVSWGGEVAAEMHTQHLNPATYTVYLDMEADSSLLTKLVSEFRLRKDPQGVIEVVQPFWDMAEIDSFPTVPLPLIYADLLATQDPRNISVAKQIAQKVIQGVNDTNR